METPLSSIVQTGDLGGQKVKMSFDENSLAHLMSVLTDLYSDKELAVIREYSTNALDAHIEAGNPDPIRVYTPSSMSPYFKIIDKGIGLSVDDITDMYSKYGASSKRETNSQVGMLGLGAKSALTLVNQFNLTSVKNGVKIFVSISRSADGSGQMEVIDTSSTTESNGVEISIPIPRSHTFADKVKDFFRFWKPGTVLVDGKEPEFITGRVVDETLIVNKNLQRDFIVMGNVAYPCTEGLYADNSYGYTQNRQMGIVAFVEIGDVNFTPSREALMYTAKTKTTIQDIRDRFSRKIAAAANKEVAEAETYGAAWRMASEWKTLFYKMSGLTYKGKDIPGNVSIAEVDPQDRYSYKGQYKVFDLYGSSHRYGSWTRAVSYSDTNVIYVYNFAESMKMSPTQREKVAIYCAQNNLSVRRVGISTADKAPTSPWLDEFTFVDWALIAPIKVVRNSPTNRVIRTDPYDLYTGQYTTKQVKTLDDKEQIIYFSPAEDKWPSYLVSYAPKAQIVSLAKNRWDKFKRDWPTAKHYLEFLADRQKEQVSKLTEADKIIWNYSNLSYNLRGLDYARIDDPVLSNFVKVINTQKDLTPLARQLRTECVSGGPRPVVDIPDNPVDDYPMISWLGNVEADHRYWYLNNFYKTLTRS